MPITLFTATDNHYAVLLAALLKSIDLNHTSGEKINFYIAGDKLSHKNKRKLEACAETGRITIIWVDVKDILKKKHILPQDNSSFPLIVYIRLFFPYFLPPLTEKAIYLDVDMIVRKDISTLWNINLDDKVIAGVPDRSLTVSSPWGGIPNFRELGLDPQTTYYNSGLLLIDCRKWIENRSTEKVLKCVSENWQYAGFPDQYGLNVIFANQWKELEPQWNSYAYKEDPDPFIIHFIGIKPIYSSYKYIAKYKKEFYYYLNQTPWFKFKPYGNHVLLLRKLMNKVTKKVNRTLSILGLTG